MSIEIEAHGLLLEVEATDTDNDGNVYKWEILSFEVDDAEEWAEWEIPSTLFAIRQHFHGADWSEEIAEKISAQAEADQEHYLENLADDARRGMI
jgi:hypothetical protein